MAATLHLTTQAKGVEFVLFDLDGLLIDSEKIYTDVTNEILSRYGVQMTWQIKSGLMGKPEHEAAAHLLSFFPAIPLTASDYLLQRRAFQNLAWPGVPLLPGAQKLIIHLHKHSIPIALATGSTKEEYKLKTAHHGVFKYFPKESIICGDDPRLKSGRGKPNPDIFLLAASTLGFMVGMEDMDDLSDDIEAELKKKHARSRGLVFEDSIPGVLAAQRAGMQVIWVPDPQLLSLQQGGDTKPTLQIHSLEDFRPEKWGLPPYQVDSA